MTRRLVDRRNQRRFEIVGDLWGTVETVLRLPVRNVGVNGALLESRVQLAVNSIHRIGWYADGHETSARVRVRRTQRVTGLDGEHTFLIGVEFLARDSLLREQIQGWLRSPSGPSESLGH